VGARCLGGGGGEVEHLKRDGERSGLKQTQEVVPRSLTAHFVHGTKKKVMRIFTLRYSLWYILTNMRNV
jgi:hypothetical protein